MSTDSISELAQKDNDFRALVEVWPYLSERARWDIFIRAWWVVFTSDLKRLFKHLSSFVGVAVETLTRK